MAHKLAMVIGEGHPAFANQTAIRLKARLVSAEVTRHANGELSVLVPLVPTAGPVVVLGCTSDPIHDSLWEFLLLIDAVHHAGASQVVACIPRLPYGRGDKPEGPGSAVGARVVAEVLEAAGTEAIVTANLHSPQIQAMFRIPLLEVNLLPVLCDAALHGADPRDWVIVAADSGRAAVAQACAEATGIRWGFLVKRRTKREVIIAGFVGPDIDGASVLIVDDELVTGSTIQAGAEFLIRRGARAVRAAVVHPVLADGAIEHIERSGIEKLCVADTVPIPCHSRRIETVPVIEPFADAIRRVCISPGVRGGRKTPGRRKTAAPSARRRLR